MNKKDPKVSRSDSTTDFFLNFITKEKSQKKEDIKNNHHVINEDYFTTKEKALNSFFRVINLFNSTLDKMLQSNLSIKILSFILSIILLFSVSGSSFDTLLSTPNGGDYITNVPVQVEGLQEDYDISGVPETVSIGLVGSSMDIYTTKLSKNYSVYVDVSGLGEGDQTVEMKTKDFPTDLKVMVEPQTVSINITKKVTKTFDLGHRFINESSMGKKYSVSIDSIEHEKVEVRGSQDKIDKIYSVDAIIDLNNVSDSFNQQSDIKAYDRSGKKIDVEIIPATVQVQCTVSSYSKKVPLVPDYSGTMAQGYGVSGIEFSKKEVTIYGEKSVLKNIENVKVKVDVTDLAENQTYKDLNLVKAEGINKMSFSQVDGDVKVASATTKAFTNLPITIKNNTKDYTVAIRDEDLASITITGVAEVLNSLTEDDICVYIDVKNVKTGRQTLPVAVELSNKSLGYKLDSANTLSVSIK